MQILIEIPSPPKRQEIIDIPLHFIDGDICEAGGYEFKVLSPHGRLIDADALELEKEVELADDWKTAHEIANCVKYAPTILEAEE